MAARDRAFAQRLLRHAGLLGWEPESSAATRESSEADAAKGFFLLGEVL